VGARDGASCGATAVQGLFNGKDLSGWVNVNTAGDTWTVRDGPLVCSGRPIGAVRTEKQYENFILHVEWRHVIHFRNIRILELPPGITGAEQVAPVVGR